MIDFAFYSGKIIDATEHEFCVYTYHFTIENGIVPPAGPLETRVSVARSMVANGPAGRLTKGERMFWTGIAIGGLIGIIIGAGMMICAIVVWAGVYRAAQMERDELTQLDFDGLVDEIRREAHENE